MRVQSPPPAPHFSQATRPPARRDEFCRRCLQNVVLRPCILAVPKHLLHTLDQGLLQVKPALGALNVLRLYCNTSLVALVATLADFERINDPALVQKDDWIISLQTFSSPFRYFVIHCFRYRYSDSMSYFLARMFPELGRKWLIQKLPYSSAESGGSQ